MHYSVDSFDAVILAGGINRIELYEGYLPGYKALLPFRGKPSVLYPLEALQALRQVRRIAVVGPQKELGLVLNPSPQIDFIAGGPQIGDSILRSLKHFRTSPLVLFVTADLPLITTQAVSDFLLACTVAEAPHAEGRNVFLSVVPASSFTGCFAGRHKGLARFSDVAVSHGNLVLVDPRILENQHLIPLMNRLYRVRKNPVRVALAVGCRYGLAFLVGAYILHRLTLEKFAALLSRRYDLGIIPVLLNHPEISMDVDEPRDYVFVKSLLEN